MTSVEYTAMNPLDEFASDYEVDYRAHRDDAFAFLGRAENSEGADHAEHIVEGLQALRDTCRSFIDQRLLSGPVGHPRPNVRAGDLPELLVCSPLLKDMSALIADVIGLIDAAAASHLEGSDEWPPECEELATSLKWFQEIECRWRLEMEGLEALGLESGSTLHPSGLLARPGSGVPSPVAAPALGEAVPSWATPQSLIRE